MYGIAIHKYNEQAHIMLANKNATNDKKIPLCLKESFNVLL